VDSIPACVRVWEVTPGALRRKANRKPIRKLRQKYGAVVEGTEKTWGKIWVQTAAPEVRAAIREQQGVMCDIADRVRNIIQTGKEGNEP
jgi:hypothetical protein